MSTNKKGRIPFEILDYHQFINITNAYLTAGGNANATRLGITASEVTTWTGFNTVDGQYFPNWSNKKIRTTDMTNNLKANIKNCHNFNKSNKILDRIAASPAATLLNLETFNIHAGSQLKSAPVYHTADITDTVVVNIAYLGGGRLQFNCRPDQTSNRSHIPDGADRLEVRAKVGDPAPVSADNTDAQWLVVSSKATVVEDFTTANVGKHVYLFFRWADSKRPQRNGPWSAMMNVVVS